MYPLVGVMGKIIMLFEISARYIAISDVVLDLEGPWSEIPRFMTE